MKTGIGFSKQSGVALVVAMLLLFVLVTLGVASFGNTHLQERSASNARLQAEAFKAASAGASNSINFFQDNRDRTDINITDKLCGALGHTGWYDPGELDAEGNPIPVPSDWVDADQPVGQATLKQRMYCLADAYPCGAEDEALGFDCSLVGRPPSQMFVLSRGEVTLDGKVVARRDIEVRLAKGQDGEPGDGCGAICFPGCEIDAENTEFPNSNSFDVWGNDGGPAITVGCPGGAETILDEIRDNRISNYHGGIHGTGAGSPWDSYTSIENFRTDIMNLAMADSTCTNCYFPGDPTTTTTINGNAEFGTIDAPQITYFGGSADIGGSISGAGIIVVNGDLYMNGTPDYQGLIVVLGGDWIIDGGGQGGNPGQQSEFGGSIVVIDVGEDGSFGDISFDNTGGGNAVYRHDCATLMRMREELLSGTEYAYNLWDPQCDPVEDIFILGPERIIIASWRENIGWRDELFAD